MAQTQRWGDGVVGACFPSHKFQHVNFFLKKNTEPSRGEPTGDLLSSLPSTSIIPSNVA